MFSGGGGKQLVRPGVLIVIAGLYVVVKAAIAVLREGSGGDPVMDYHVMICAPEKVCHVFWSVSLG